MQPVTSARKEFCLRALRKIMGFTQKRKKQKLSAWLKAIPKGTLLSRLVKSNRDWKKGKMAPDSNDENRGEGRMCGIDPEHREPKV